MPDLSETIADGFARVDEVASDNADAFVRRYQELLYQITQRNEAIWTAAEAPVEYTIDNAFSVPVAQRGPEWTLTVSAMLTAARSQAYAEVVVRPLIAAVNKGSSKTRSQAKNMDNAELRKQAKQGVSKAQFDEAKTRRAEKKTSS